MPEDQHEPDKAPSSDEPQAVSQEPDTQNSGPTTQDSPNWQYNAEDSSQSTLPNPPSVTPVEWTASEFVEHEKQATWFVGLAGVAAAASGLVYLITREIVTTVVIVIAAVLFGVAALRKPNTLEYRIDEKGVKIGPKFYPYAQFRSFSVIDEGALSSVQLMPLGRFTPPISLYYPPNQEDQIANTLGSYLPHEQRSRDLVDRLMHRIRF